MNTNTNIYLKLHTSFCFMIIVFFHHTIYASENIFHLTTEQWAVPKSVSTILTMKAISSTMQAIQLNNGSLLIHHPGGDEGTLWATELRGWLISLGLSTTKINLIPGSSGTNQLDLEVISKDNTIETNE